MVQLASSVAITVATAVYLWSKETEDHCEAPLYEDEWGNTGDYIDVSVRFRDILKIWFAYGIIDIFRCAFVFAYLNYKFSPLAYLYHGFALNDLLYVGALLILHAYRFQYPGKYCAGDYLDESKPTPGYLIERGKYLLGLVIYVWVALFVSVCVMSCVYTAAYRRLYENPKQNQHYRV